MWSFSSFFHDLTSSEIDVNLTPRENWDVVKGSPVRVECGEKPANASTNCKPSKSPCLFNIAKDPCEYNNIADSHSDVVSADSSHFGIE